MVYLPLVGVTAVRDIVGIADGDTAYDRLLYRWISEVSDDFRTRTGLDINKNTYTERFDIEENDETQLFVSQIPITSVVAITDDTSLIPATDYYLPQDRTHADGMPRNPGIIALHYDSDPGTFTKGPKKVVVTYQAGYTTVPKDIQHGVSVEIARRFQKKNALAYSGEKIGTYSYSVSTEPVAVEYKEIVNLYRKRRV